MGFNAPYKTTLKALETNLSHKIDARLIAQRLLQKTFMKITKKAPSSSNSQIDPDRCLKETKIFTKLYAKEIVTAHPRYFYDDAPEKVRGKEYHVKAQTAKCRKKAHVKL